MKINTTIRILLVVFFIGFLAGVPPQTACAKEFIFVHCVTGVQIIDCETDEIVDSIPCEDYVPGATPSPDRKRYYTVGSEGGGTIYVFDTKNRKLVDTYQISHPLSKVHVAQLAVSEDNSKLYMCVMVVKRKHNIPKLDVLPPTLVVFDIATKQVIRSYTLPFYVMGIFTLKNDPDHLLLGGLDLLRLDLKSGKVETALGLLHTPQGQVPMNVHWAFNPGLNAGNGETNIWVNPYYSATGMGYLYIDRSTGKVWTVKAQHLFLEYSTLLSPDKKYIYAIGDQLIKVDATTGETVNAVHLERGNSFFVNISPDGKKLYCGPSGADISVYDAETLQFKKAIILPGDALLAHRMSL